MRRQQRLELVFTEFLPDKLTDGKLYISMQYATASHKCCCGCGYDVVTPISPKDWQLTFDGRSISLKPSIGNWSYPCRSHYWIQQNRVVWCDPVDQADRSVTRYRGRWSRLKGWLASWR